MIVSIWLGLWLAATGDKVGTSWRRVDDGLADRFSCVSWDGPVIVGVGTRGLIATSIDGKSWVTRFQPVHTDLKGVAWNGSHYVAVGRNGAILRSIDGIAWQRIDAPSENNYAGVTWSGTQFIAVDGATYLSTSADGVVWTRMGISGSAIPTGIAHFDGATYIQNTYGIARSTDLVTWTQVLSMSNNTSPTVIRKLNGRLITVGAFRGIRSSSDGITWTSGSLDGDYYRSGDLRDIAWSGTCYVAVGTANSVWRSEDGLAWTSVNAVAGNADYVRWIDGEFVIGGSGRSIQTSPDGREWTTDRINTYSQGTAAVSTGSRFIRVGDFGYIATSSDFESWTSRDSGTISHFLSVVWTGSFALASGMDGVMLKSADGLVWSRVAESTFTGSVRLVWNGSQLFAFSSEGTHTSTDGIAWTRISTAAAWWLNDIQWLRGMFIGIGYSGIIQTSPDGVVWTKRTSGTTATLFAAGASEEGFLVGGVGVLLASADGINWTQRTSPVGTTSALDHRFGRWILASVSEIHHSLDGISWNMVPDIVGMSGFSNQSKLVWTGSELVCTALDAATTDGKSWNQLEIRTTAPDFKAVVKGNNGYVAIGSEGAIWHSPNGYAWEGIESPTDKDLVALAASPGGWVAIGANGVIVASHDGIDWTLCSSGSEIDLHDIAWNGTRFAAVGDSGTILSSSDGYAWFPQESGSTADIFNIVSTGSAFRAFAEYGITFESPDGIIWSVSQLDTMADVVWNGASYVAVASGGSAAWAHVSSPDALQWTRHPAAATNFLSGVCWTGIQHVACGSNGTIVTSPDGVTWTPQESGTTQWLRAIVWSGNQLVAVGHRGTLLASADGITWRHGVKPGTVYDYQDVAWAEGRYVAVGTNGASATSTDGLNWQSMTGIVGTNYTVERVGNRFLAGGSDYFYSASETQWQSEGGVPPLRINEFEWNGSELFAATTDGVYRFLESNLGGWSGIQVHASPWLDKMASHDGEFVATGSNGTVVLSRDGVSWENVQGGREHAFEAVAWNGNRMVGVRSSQVQVSPDGATWNAPDSPIPTYGFSLRDVIWTGSRFLTLGSSRLFLSSDAKLWTSIDRAVSPSASGVAGDDEFLVAVGGDGIIFVSDGSGDAAVDYESWISSQGADSRCAAALQDANGDGISNLIAYILGIQAVGATTPTDRSAMPTVSINPGDGSPVAIFDLRESYRTGAIYNIEVSPDMQTGSWKTVQCYSTGWEDRPGRACVTESPLPGGGIRITVTNFPEPGSNENCFIRLRAILP